MPTKKIIIKKPASYTAAEWAARQNSRTYKPHNPELCHRCKNRDKTGFCVIYDEERNNIMGCEHYEIELNAQEEEQFEEERWAQLAENTPYEDEN